MAEKPKTTAGDIAYAAAKAVLGSIPVVGATAAEVFALAVEPPLAKRRNEWIESIAQGLQQLEQKATRIFTYLECRCLRG